MREPRLDVSGPRCSETLLVKVLVRGACAPAPAVTFEAEATRRLLIAIEREQGALAFCWVLDVALPISGPASVPLCVSNVLRHPCMLT